MEIAQAGRYQFALRRWPPETQHAIDAGIEGDDVEWRREWVDEDYWHWYTGGRASP